MRTLRSLLQLLLLMRQRGGVELALVSRQLVSPLRRDQLVLRHRHGHAHGHGLGPRHGHAQPLRLFQLLASLQRGLHGHCAAAHVHHSPICRQK